MTFAAMGKVSYRVDPDTSMDPTPEQDIEEGKYMGSMVSGFFDWVGMQGLYRGSKGDSEARCGMGVCVGKVDDASMLLR